MGTKWVVVLSDGTTWEVVSPAMQVYEVNEEEVSRLVDGERIGEVTNGRAGLALFELLPEGGAS